MARKAPPDSHAAHGFNDILGVVLPFAALLLLVAQLSFDRGDLAFNQVPPNHPAHNWIGPAGAQLARATFFVFGFSAYMLPLILVIVGLGCWLESLAYLKRRWIWAVVLLVSCMGCLPLLGLRHLHANSPFV